MQTDHIKMLYDIGELNNLLAGSLNVGSLLQKIVEMVAKYMNAKVCSIYLYDDEAKELVLKATVGLKPGSINQIKLKPGEGLVGLALEELKPICEKCASDNPKYKFYPGFDEELFQSFLAVPILRGNIKIGVFVVQRIKGETFAEDDILALRATASQLASMIENIKNLITTTKNTESSKYREKSAIDTEKLKFIRGKTASEGYAYSDIIVIERENLQELVQKIHGEKNYTVDEFEEAIKNTEEQLEMLQSKVEEKLSDAASLIFSAHLLMLKDTAFTGNIREMIIKGEDVLSALMKKYSEYKEIFSKSRDQLLREKVQDIEDLTKRIIENLAHIDTDEKRYKNHIAIVRELYPSDLLIMSAEDIKGIIQVSGGATAHVSILARSLRIPVVIVSLPELLELPENTTALVDAETGNIYINPASEILSKFEERNKARINILREENINSPAVTSDGIRIRLMANINLLSDVKNIKNIYNDGIGLYRTEFPFIIRNNFPTEEEQFIIYTKLVSDMKDKQVIFRTLDIGGDKVLSYYNTGKEENPFLGMRSIRFSLSHREIFKQQIRAILRAGYKYDIGIMFPMISSLDEFLTSRDIVFECIQELHKAEVEHIHNPKIGLMVEIPSLVTIIEEIAKEADFMSIGTNDLIQYTLAVDRTNVKVADLYNPHHPAILKSLKLIADAAIATKTEAAICGDMGGNLRYIPFLIGIGIHTLSVDSAYLPKVKRAISRISAKDAEAFAKRLLSLSRINEINQLIESQIVDI